MPTKPAKPLSKKAQAQKEALKKQRIKDKVVFASIIIVIVIVVIVLYFVLRGRSSETDVAGVPKNIPGQTGSALQGTGLPQEVQAVLSKAKLKLESVNNKDIVKVIVEKPPGRDGVEMIYRYDWSINGQPAGDGSDSLSGFKRGDKVAVKVTPFEGEKALQARVLEFSIQNTPPHVSEDKQFKYDGKSFSYQVKCTDPDGDTLTYELTEAPQGMSIDPKTGTINWQLTENDYGQHNVKVKISDNKGGVAMHPFKIDLPKPTEEKKPAENKK
ncbi:MAG TPA: Ig domain-containing protein [Syntrophorhabdaceae bacterium]|nr:Ig domain-containing protein [Syntrophorhabdaceae bacterium]